MKYWSLKSTQKLIFALNEVVKLKKEVQRLRGITEHLLKVTGKDKADAP